jgi:RHS repeat-associated protein
MTGQSSFLGYQADMTDPDTKQVDMGTRWYQVGLGRFTARDVIFGELTSPMTLNQHVYGGLNPITMWDPTGMYQDDGGGGGGCGDMGLQECMDYNQETYNIVHPSSPSHAPPRPDPPDVKVDGAVLCSHGGGLHGDTCAGFDFDSYQGDWYRSCSRFTGCQEIAGHPSSFLDDLKGAWNFAWRHKNLVAGLVCLTPYGAVCVTVAALALVGNEIDYANATPGGWSQNIFSGQGMKVLGGNLLLSFATVVIPKVVSTELGPAAVAATDWITPASARVTELVVNSPGLYVNCAMDGTCPRP